MADEFFEVEVNFDEADGMPVGTYLFNCLASKPWVKKDETGAPTDEKAVIVEIEAIAGSNADGIGQVHEEFFKIPKSGDAANVRKMRQQALVDLARAGQLVTEEEAKGKGKPQYANLKGRKFVATVAKKNGYTSLTNLTRPDDPAVAHIVGSVASAPARSGVVI